MQPDAADDNSTRPLQVASSKLAALKPLHTNTQTHTLLFSQKGRFLFDPLWGLSPKPKCQHELLTDSVSSNNPVTVHILRAGDQQLTRRTTERQRNIVCADELGSNSQNQRESVMQEFCPHCKISENIFFHTHHVNVSVIHHILPLLLFPSTCVNTHSLSSSTIRGLQSIQYSIFPEST